MSDRPSPVSSPARNSISALTLTAPVAMGYIPLGAIFGFLFVQAGGEWWLAVLASIFIFAGAAQYMMIPMIASGMSMGAIAVATLIVNLRHVFYGLSLLDRQPRNRFLSWYLMFALTDETYSVLTAMPEGTDDKPLVMVAFLNQIWWVLGSLVGAGIGARSEVTLVGLDFALVALFCVLTIEQWRSRKSSAPFWIALLAYTAAYQIAPDHALVISIALSVAALATFQAKTAELSIEVTSHD